MLISLNHNLHIFQIYTFLVIIYSSVVKEALEKTKWIKLNGGEIPNKWRPS
jgi:hypothetical protein